jgi:hypothetical protein
MLPTSCRLHRILVCLSMLALASPSHANPVDKVRMRVIAQSGETAPSGLGLNLSLFELETLVDATINDRGDVVYRALTNRSFQNRQRVGLWIDPMQVGEPDRYLGILDFVAAPGAPSSSPRFRGVSLPILSDSGNSLATEFLDDDLGNARGIWLATDQAILPVLVPGQQAPELVSGELVYRADGVAYTGGDTGLISAYTNQDRHGLWRFSNGAFDLLAINRTSIPELPGFAFTGDSLVGKINDLGTAVVRGRVTNGVTNRDALFHIAVDGTRDVLVSEGVGGSLVPGAPAGSTFDGFDGFRINDAGAISIDTSIRLPNGEIGRGIWLQNQGETLKPVVLTGMATPDGDAKFEWLNASGLNYNLNELGHFGFSATLRRANGEAVNSSWIGSENGIELLAKAGDQAPGFAPGVIFRGTAMPQLNDRGTAFMTVQLGGPGIINGLDSALFYRTLGDQLRPLIWCGQLLELFPGDTRKVVSYDSPLAEAGRETQINNRNEAAIAVLFDDGSSAVVVFAIIPEPTAASLVLAAGGLLMTRRQNSASYARP